MSNQQVLQSLTTKYQLLAIIKTTNNNAEAQKAMQALDELEALLKGGK